MATQSTIDDSAGRRIAPDGDASCYRGKSDEFAERRSSREISSINIRPTWLTER
jgi:hypothetical protein